MDKQFVTRTESLSQADIDSNHPKYNNSLSEETLSNEAFKKAVSDSLELLQDVDSSDLYFYQLYVNNSLLCVCYGVCAQANSTQADNINVNSQISYSILFNEFHKNFIGENKNKYYIALIKSFMNFINKVITNTQSRNKQINEIEFQIDLSENYPMFTDYTFLIEPPLKLTDKLKLGSESRIFSFKN